MKGYPFNCISDFIFVDTGVVPADIILIPGNADLEPVKKAAELYHKGLAPLLLPSGGPNTEIGGFASEWEYMQNAAIREGIPADCILREDRAANTFENARFSLQCIRECRLTVKNAILVCREFHSRRALMTYQTIFSPEIRFHVATVPRTCGITKENWFKSPEGTKLVMKEVTKIGQYFECEIQGLTQRFSFPEADS